MSQRIVDAMAKRIYERPPTKAQIEAFKRLRKVPR